MTTLLETKTGTVQLYPILEYFAKQQFNGKLTHIFIIFMIKIAM